MAIKTFHWSFLLFFLICCCCRYISISLNHHKCRQLVNRSSVLALQFHSCFYILSERRSTPSGFTFRDLGCSDLIQLSTSSMVHHASFYHKMDGKELRAVSSLLLRAKCLAHHSLPSFFHFKCFEVDITQFLVVFSLESSCLMRWTTIILS